MKLHGSAALSQRQRRRLVGLVGSGMTIAAAAAIVGCSRQTGSKWVNRHRRGEGLEDRILAPGHRVTGDRSKRAQGRAGWQYLFVAIDDATRLACAGIYPDETAASAIAFLTASHRFYAQHGIRIERLLTDNGTCFKRRWHERCDELKIGVRKTRPYRPHRALAGQTPLQRVNDLSGTNS